MNHRALRLAGNTGFRGEICRSRSWGSSVLAGSGEVTSHAWEGASPAPVAWGSSLTRQWVVVFEGPCLQRRSIPWVPAGLGIRPDWECSAGVGESQLQALHPPGAGVGPGSVTLQRVYPSFIWAGVQWGLASKTGFLMKKKKVFQKTGIQLAHPGEDRTHSGPSWLCSSCNKEATQPSLSFTLSIWQICALCGPRRAGRDQGYSHPTEPGGSAGSPGLCAASIRSRNPQGKGKLQLTALVYFGGGFPSAKLETGSILNDA